MKKVLLVLLLLSTMNIFSGEFRLLTFTDYFGQIEASNGYDNLRQRNYVRPEFNADLFDYTAFFSVSGEFYYDYFADEQIPDSSNILREFYFTFYLPFGDLTVGQKFTNKGKVDVFSPLNLYNGSYRELLSLDEPYQSKRADLQLEIKYYINDENSLELVYIPFPRPDYQGKGELTVDDGRLDFELNKESDPYLFDFKYQSFYLNYSRYGFDSDLQLFYGYYTNRKYDFDLSDLYVSGSNLRGELEKEYNRTHTIGAAFSTNIGSFALNEEIAFNLTEDFDGDEIGVRNSDITLNSQVTKTLFGRVTSNFNLICQYIINYDKADTNYSTKIDKELISAINDVHLQPNEHIIVAVVHFHDYFLREKLYVALNSALLFPRVYIGPRVSYKFKDYLSVETGVDFFTGKYENNLLDEDLGGDNFFIRFKYEL